MDCVASKCPSNAFVLKPNTTNKQKKCSGRSNHKFGFEAFPPLDVSEFGKPVRKLPNSRSYGISRDKFEYLTAVAIWSSKFSSCCQQWVLRSRLGLGFRQLDCSQSTAVADLNFPSTVFLICIVALTFCIERPSYNCLTSDF